MIESSGTSIWQLLLFGALALLIIFIFRPGLKQAFKDSNDSETKDWLGLLLPIGLVILFVFLLISLI